MSKYDHQETDIMFAHGKWMRKWDIEYPSSDVRFEDFKNNVLRQPFIPASEALWDLLNNDADQPRTESMVPVVKQEDGSIFGQEADLMNAFQKWKRTWKKEYPSTDEEEARFRDFKNNILHQPFIPASDPLWDLLNDQADQPRTDNFNYIRLDFCKLDEESDDDLPNGLYFAVPDKKEDGTIGPRYVTPEEFRRYCKFRSSS